jgi:hypothetical protein
VGGERGEERCVRWTFESGVSIFVLCVCVGLGQEPACTKLGTTFLQSGAIP